MIWDHVSDIAGSDFTVTCTYFENEPIFGEDRAGSFL
jgi:hypothetical protein